MLKADEFNRKSVSVRFAARLLGVSRDTIFCYIKEGRVESFLKNKRKRLIYLDSFVPENARNRRFVSVESAAKIICISQTRILLYANHGLIEYFLNPGGRKMIFVDSLTSAEIGKRRLVTINMAVRMSGLSSKQLYRKMDEGEIEFVTIPSGARRIFADTLRVKFTSSIQESLSLSA